MRIITSLLLTVILSSTFAWGQSKASAPENTKQLDARVNYLRAKMAPFLQSLPPKLDVRKRKLLSGDDWVKRFEVAPKTKGAGVAQPAWEKVGLNLSKWKQTEVPEWSYQLSHAKTPVSCI